MPLPDCPARIKMEAEHKRGKGQLANDFRSARFWAASLIKGALYSGARAVDATLGNGHDALWLCQQVGPEGRVYGFDIQKDALDRSRARLEAQAMAERAQLILDGHEHMDQYIAPESIDAVMFNLGWLPGSAHEKTTRVETTLRAVQTALCLLRTDGIMTICIYPGHEEGARECRALLDWAQNLERAAWDVMLQCYLNQGEVAPLMIAVKKNRRKNK